MIYWDQIIIKIISIFTLFGGVIIILFILDLIYYYFNKKTIFGLIWRKLNNNSLIIIFIVSFGGTVFSLIFSEILNFTPCPLCWYQRIFMYPIVILSLIAVIKKDKNILRYVLVLAILGTVISAYHYYGENLNPSFLPCQSTNKSYLCNEKFISEFGYITIPMMSLTAFLLIIITSLLGRKKLINSY